MSFTESISNAFSKATFELKKNGPDILVVAGVIGSVAATVLACVATTKMPKVLDEHEKKLKEIDERYSEKEVFSEKEKNKEIASVYAKTTWQVVKLYSLSAFVEAASLASIIGSHKMMGDRNIANALAAKDALAGLALAKESLKQYRDKVREKIGDEEESKLWNSKDARVDPNKAPEVKENYEELKKKEKNPAKIGPYARIFDAGNEGWDPNPEMTLFYLRCIESQANNLLQSRGHLFLNDVYDLLGYPRTRMGQFVGWIDNPNDPKRHCHVDFGLYDVHDRLKSAFVNGYEQNVILEFNVDGVIVNDIPDEKYDEYLK